MTPELDPWTLLEIAESANAPNFDESNDCGNRSFQARDGWTVVMFYDAGDLDYIDHFVTPEGNDIDFWEWPESEAKRTLINWRGNGDLARIRAS